MKLSFFLRPVQWTWLLLAILVEHPLTAQTPVEQRPALIRSSSGTTVDNSPNQASAAQSPTAWTANAPGTPGRAMRAIAEGSVTGIPGNSADELNAAGSVPAQRTPLNPTPRDEAAGQELGGTRSTAEMLVSLASSLLIVVALFLGVAWFYRKSMNNGLGYGLPKQVVDVLGRTPIAARQQLVLVRFGPKLVLISIVQGEARTISEIDEPLEVDRLAGLCESSKPGSISQSFRHVLAQGGAA